MEPLVTAAQMRAIDRETIEEIGIPAALLMEHAGRGVADVVAACCPARGRVAVLCGPGNNGGDGFVCARWLRERGFDARVVLARGRPRPGGEAALQLAIYEKLGGPVGTLDEAATAEVLGAQVVVDALLGTGLSDEVKGPLAAAIELVNRASGVKVAVDVPSGMSSDDGRTLGVAVRADVTATLAFAKVGLVSHPGCELAGDVRVVDIGIPRRLAASHAVAAFALTAADAAALVPARSMGSHKGTHGHVLVVAGSPEKPGAASLCAAGALRAGAGLVTLAAAPAVHAALVARHPEVMGAPLDLEAPGAERALAALAEGKRAVVVGPGMPTGAAAGAATRRALASLPLPAVIDADGLNHLVGDLTPLHAAPAARVLTPHPGEAGRLLESDAGAVQADRVGAARRLAARTGAVVVLKGARTVVAARDGTATLNPTGNPGLGTGGTGDVLAGVIAALLAQGLAPLHAARLGAYVHGLAGDLAAEARGTIGIVAGDVADLVPRALATLSQHARKGVNETRVPPATPGSLIQ